MCNHWNTDKSLLKSCTDLKSFFKPSENIFRTLGALFMMVAFHDIDIFFEQATSGMVNNSSKEEM